MPKHLPRLDRVAAALRGRVKDDRGALSLELAFLAPVVMMLIFGVVQLGFYWYARDVALTAAQQGVETARLQGASLSEGSDRTWDLLHRTGGSITGTSVATSQDGNTVVVTVSGQVDCWIPGLTFPVSQTARAAKEQVTP
ncbi:MULTISPECIES: TadE/TadG family type IV pilus assembly protein [Streptacidiphilus]|uniref:TadE/TadG family type IV pilus assembly protein n=1 Tax=Streptacidiphilus cavernicola TaxID=3342716 RepID=A0ABV6UW79_9ACTN|nr:TadE/TadG family type IV pilus assembly protein [Streptacidiphilus jeojiense]